MAGIGRNARAEADGVAITIITKKEQASFAAIEKLLDKVIPKEMVPAELGPAPEYNPLEVIKTKPTNRFKFKKKPKAVQR